ncbi:MAG: GntR family transcriptional regulator, partial [Azorhizobium sp. 32-67-21]
SVREVAAEHDDIVRSVLNGDADAAVEALSQHYRRTMDIARSVL